MQDVSAYNEANVMERLHINLLAKTKINKTPAGDYEIVRYRHKGNTYIGIYKDGLRIKARPVLLAYCESRCPNFKRSRMWDPDISNQTLTSFVKCWISEDAQKESTK
jgi:hypothetical protein